MDTGLVFPLVRVVEVLVDMVVLLCVAEEDGEEETRGEDVLATVGEEEKEEEEGRKEGEVCMVGDVLEVLDGEGRIGREYVRRAGVAVVVSLGGAGTRT